MTDNLYVLVLIAMLGTFAFVVGFMLIFIRNQRSMLKQKEEAQQAEIEYQKNLLKAIVESQEEERKRIGQDLHDDVGTSLSNLKLNINHILTQPQGEEQTEKLKSTFKQFIEKIIYDVRTISHRLTPEILTINTLSEALGELFSTISASGSLQIVYDTEKMQKLDIFTVHEATSIYRVIEELLNNTIKHSGANQVIFEVNDTGAGIDLSYQDNGKGIPAETKGKGRGMQNIESRLGLVNARYELHSGKGYRIEVRIPYPKSSS